MPTGVPNGPEKSHGAARQKRSNVHSGLWATGATRLPEVRQAGMRSGLHSKSEEQPVGLLQQGLQFLQVLPRGGE